MTAREQAEQGVQLLKDAVVSYIDAHPYGVTNAEIAEALRIRSDFEGNQKDYLSYSILGLLISDRRVRHEKVGNRKLYFAYRPN